MVFATAYNELPEASVWILGIMIVSAILFALVLPSIHRKRKKREQAELHEKIQEAATKILKDGKIEGPKGPYVQQIPWDVGTQTGTPRKGSIPTPAYHGGPWPK